MPLAITRPTNLITAGDDIVSLEECREYLGDFELTDERILEIRNNMIGIVDRIINCYLEDFER